MVICVCKAVTGSRIQAAIEKGMCNRKQLVQCFGAGKDCGKCNKEVKAVLEKSTAQARRLTVVSNQSYYRL